MIAWLILTTLAQAGEPLTLDDALARAETHPVVDAADAEARAARADTATAWLGAVGPRIGGSLTTTSRTEELAIDTPIGPFVQQPKDVATGGFEAHWPIVDAAGLLGRAPAAAAGAQAAELQAQRTRDLVRLRAGEAYLDVLVVDARIAAIDRLIASLESRRSQADQLVTSGLAVRADRLRLDVALADASVARTRLVAGREAALSTLAWRLGSDATVELDFAWARPDDPPAVTAALDTARERHDLRALDAQRRALLRQQRATWLETVPTVGLWGRYSWTDNDQLVANEWVEGGIELSWTAVAGGTRISRARAQAQRKQAIEARIEDVERGLSAELAGARAQLVGALAEVDARSLAVEQATEAERLLASRYDQGLAPLTDVLQATASRAEQEAALQISRLEATRAWLRWTAARGGTGR